MQPYVFGNSRFDLQASDPFPNGQSVWRPIVKTELSADRKKLSCLMWLDSGADHCVFPLSFALLLGLDTLEMKTHLTGGVGNSGNAS